jgi:hypothetical protein
MTKFLFPLWIVASLLLFLYSYTQVSLSLALTSYPQLYSVQQVFQYVGYFNRPLSSILFSVIIIVLFVLFLCTIRAINKKSLSAKQVFIIIGSICTILVFSYNAFSHDIFNYIFDAKIFTYYQQNPYEHKALDFPGDPMLSFMQWTHRTYPYGPVWLGISIPVSYLGFNYFLLTFLLFKILAVGAYIGTAWCIYQIGKIIKKDSAVLMTAFFALNPLMIIEFLVSAHNDIVMLFLAMASILLVVQEKRFLGMIGFLFSVGVKYATAFLSPMMLVLSYNKKFYNSAVGIGIVSMILAVVAAALKSGNFQPWYFSYVVVISALLAYKKFVQIPVIVFTFFSCLYYLPYLYTGSWNAPVPEILRDGLAISCIVTSVLFVYLFFADTADKSRL